MSKEQLCAVNKKLLEHLKENEKYNAFYYEPVNNVYWKEKIKIAFCNLEPYSKNKYTANGFEKLDENTLYDIWFFTKTTGNTVFLNLVLRKKMSKNIQVTGKTFSEIRRLGKNDDSLYDELCEEFNKSLYFNFRYSLSDIVNQSSGYIYGRYINDEFYRRHFREYVKAAEIDILVVSGTVGSDLIQIIFPELKGKFSYCGEPVYFDGILFVSIPHPSRISYDAMADCVNKISNALK